MTAGRTSAAGGGESQVYRYCPYSEFNNLCVDQLFAVTGVGLMTDTTGAALAVVDNVDIMKVAFAVAKFRVNCCVCKPKQILFMAGKACTIYAFFIRDINFSRIAPPQHTEII